MKALKALKIKMCMEVVWKSPVLHVLITNEDDVIVARCLDFTVSSHGEDEKDVLNFFIKTRGVAPGYIKLPFQGLTNYNKTLNVCI